MSPARRLLEVMLLAAAALAAGACSSLPTAHDETPRTLACPAPGQWTVPGQAEPVNLPAVLDQTGNAQVILLGEFHDSEEDHRWQLHTLAALHGRHPDLEIGLEMLPASRQPVLDRWLAGELDDAALLDEADWFSVWGYPSRLYLPVLQFARMHQRPLHALNAEGETVRRVSREGWDALEDTDLEQVGPPAEIPQAYRDRLSAQLDNHPMPPGLDRDDYLEMFIRGQSVWDRAMAERLADAVQSADGPVVALIGRGHLDYGHGVPHQLRDLGIQRIATLLPMRDDDCPADGPPIADALFGVDGGMLDTRSSAMRLGISLQESGEGLVVSNVMEGGTGDAAGLKPGDHLRRAGGRTLHRQQDLLAMLDRQQPGTALILVIDRDGETRTIAVPHPQ